MSHLVGFFVVVVDCASFVGWEIIFLNLDKVCCWADQLMALSRACASFFFFSFFEKCEYVNNFKISQ